uniref:Tail assembly chaperone n=1 Tax=Mycobacterium phage Farewell TaxID=3158893 RepID=A0AAU8GL86_9CAUD
MSRRIGVDVEIVEATRNVDDVNQLGVIVPDRLRLNGMEIVWPRDCPPVIIPNLEGHDAAMVTITMYARSVRICAERDGLPDAGTPIYDQLMAEHRATTAPEPQFDTPTWRETEVTWFLAHRDEIEARQHKYQRNQ